MSTFAYLYRWTQKSTGMWYEGSRTERGCHPEDGYICSSKKVKPMITENLEDWTREILVIGEPSYIRKLEELRLNDLDAKTDPMSYNEDNADGKFSTTGKAPWNKGIKRPRGTPSWNKGISNPTHSARMKGRTAPNKGVPMSEEQKAKLSAARKGKPSNNKGKPSPCKGKPNLKISERLKGRKQSPEHIAKRVAARLAKTKEA